jgi:hypothetical protein
MPFVGTGRGKDLSLVGNFRTKMSQARPMRISSIEPNWRKTRAEKQPRQGAQVK